MKISDNQNQFASPLIELPENQNFFVIVGSNNSGKSTFLRSINRDNSEKSFLVNVNRTIIKGEGALDRNYMRNYPSYVQNISNAQDDNIEKPTQILQDYFALKDADRKPIIDWYNKYFPNQIYEEREDPENTASSMFLKINGQSITKQGSGMRSTLEIFIKLFDPEIKILCIDEPELGLEPVLQKYLFNAIREKSGQEKKIFIATHSHHFLDLENANSNYICERNSDDKILLKKAENLKDVIFRLLGNTLSSFLLPEKVLIVEGISDTTYIQKLLSLLNKKNIYVHGSGADANIKYAINAISQFLKFNDSLAVYKNNVYVVADRARDTLVREWAILLSDNSKISVLSENGIEYYYPEHVLQKIFVTTDPSKKIISEYLKNTPNQFNGIILSKPDLAKKVVELIDKNALEDNSNELFKFLKTID